MFARTQANRKESEQHSLDPVRATAAEAVHGTREEPFVETTRLHVFRRGVRENKQWDVRGRGLEVTTT